MSEPPNSDDEISTIGWDDITAALKRLYSGQEPRHWGTILNYCLGGRDPLDGISAYLHDDGMGASHWHFVSFGMSELYAKECENREISGWGFEFTFRLKRESSDAEPPEWVFSLLQNLARYVFNSGNVFAPGHYLPLNGPIALGKETAIHAAMFAEDPELGEIETLNGKLEFLQLVGTTLDELTAAQAWNTSKLLDVMRQVNPLLVTDLFRQSILLDPDIAQTVDRGATQDGSSTAFLAVRELEISEAHVARQPNPLMLRLGASGVTGFKALLRGAHSFRKRI